MEYNNTIKEFFGFINQECLFYIIDVYKDGKVKVKWENMKPDDYIIVPEISNRINLRLQKTRHQKTYKHFLDCFQHFEDTTYWKGFPMGNCTYYEMMLSGKDWFDVVFYFENNQQITIHHINTEVFLILQDFFSGFM